MRFHHVLALTASVGVASAKCKPRSSASTLSSTSASDSSIVSGSSTASTSSVVQITSSTSSEEASTTTTSSSTSEATIETTSSSDISSPSVTTSSSDTSSPSVTTSSSDTSTPSVTTSTSDANSSDTSSSDTTSSDTTSSVGTTSISDTITTSSTAPASSTTTTSSTAAPTPTQICQGVGSRTSAAISISTKIADTSFGGCRALCLAQQGCQSFSFDIQTGGACSLYDSPLYLDFQSASSGTTFFFDSDCPAPVISGPTIALVVPTAGAPTQTVPSTIEPVETFPAFTAPAAIVSSDSPPYVPTGPQPTPTDDNEFIATYTYTEFQLPTMVNTGYPPVTTGIGLSLPSDMPCLLSTGQANQFTLLNEDFIPMVTRTGSIGPLLQPTAAPAADDPILNPLTFTVPPFYLQAVAGVSDVYDMIYAETGEYVAMTTDGKVVLTSASTGTSFNGDVVTSIFSFDCRGALLISQGGHSYTWSTQGESCTIEQTSAPNTNMKTLPVSVPKVQVQDRKRTVELIEKLKKRGTIKEARDVNANFHEPTCPNTPAGLVRGTKSDYKTGEGNFCDNLNEWWGLSPFDFDDACTLQSACFDQCTGFSFAGCTAIFSYAMYFSCADNFKEWWEVAKAVACAAQATVFVGLASSSTGQQLYNKAQDAMCRCFCSNPSDTCVYLDSSGALTDNFYCADIHGTDMANCGSCGGQCGPNSACRGGKCGCPVNMDQCGTTCLDLRNNPNNCGACGNPCDPKYCIGGQCYKPQPGQCAPDQGVTNNWFADYQYGFANWTVSAFPGTTYGTDAKFGASLYTYAAGKPAVNAIGVSMNNLPSNGAGFSLMLRQANVKMCPGFNYELKFNMGYVNQVNGQGITSNADCTVRWLTGPPSSPSTNDNYLSSPAYQIGASHPAYQTFGPWAVGAATVGQPGVTKQGPDLFIDLTAVITCASPPGGFASFVITDIELNPTTQVTKRSEEEEGSVRQLVEQRESDFKPVFVPIEPSKGVQNTTFVSVSARRRGL